MPRTVAPRVWVFKCRWVSVPGKRNACEGPQIRRAHANVCPERRSGRLHSGERLLGVSIVERRMLSDDDVLVELRSVTPDTPLPHALDLAPIVNKFHRLSPRPQLVGFDAVAELRQLIMQGYVARPTRLRPIEEAGSTRMELGTVGLQNSIVDLANCFGHLGVRNRSLHELARRSGVPAMDSWVRGGLEESRAFECDVDDRSIRGRHSIECDSITSYLLWLRVCHRLDIFNAAQHAEEEGRIESMLERRVDEGELHLEAFLQRWRMMP